jgi:hypothetical protein
MQPNAFHTAILNPISLDETDDSDSDYLSLTESDSDPNAQGDVFGQASEPPAALDNATLTALARRVIAEVLNFFFVFKSANALLLSSLNGLHRQGLAFTWGPVPNPRLKCLQAWETLSIETKNHPPAVSATLRSPKVWASCIA